MDSRPALPREDHSTTDPRERLRGHLALVMVQLCFGLFPLFGKLAFEGFGPRGVASWRIAFGAALLGTLAFARYGRRALPALRDLPRLQICALLGITINQVLFLEGLNRAPSVNAGLVMATIPAFTLLVAVIARQERVRALRVLGFAVAFGGTAALALREGLDLDGRYLQGNVLLTLNSLSYSIYLVAARPLAKRYPPLVLIAWIFILCLWTIPFFAPLEALLPGRTGSDAWLALIYILIFPTVLAYLLNTYALARVRASTTAVYVFGQPLIAGAAGVIIMGESLGSGTLLPAAAILLGLWLVVLRR